MSAVHKEEVRVFQSSLDKTTVNSTVFAQPSFYMGIGNGLLMVLTQLYPLEFVTPKVMTMSYNSIKAYSLVSVPFCFISGVYFAIASIIATAPTPLAGHLMGYSFSLLIGLTMMNFRRVSWYYPLMGLGYMSYGSLHHYRRMMVFGDNAPIFNWSDFGAIYADMRTERAKEKELHRKQREATRSIR